MTHRKRNLPLTSESEVIQAEGSEKVRESGLFVLICTIRTLPVPSTAPIDQIRMRVHLCCRFWSTSGSSSAPMQQTVWRSPPAAAY